jgi:hypothetical protein
MARGCEPTGPVRPWIRAANRNESSRASMTSEDDEALALELLRPIDAQEPEGEASSPAPRADAESQSGKLGP